MKSTQYKCHVGAEQRSNRENASSERYERRERGGGEREMLWDFFNVWLLYIVHGSGKREERVICDETPVDADVAKYNCAMLVIYSRRGSPECMRSADAVR